MLNFSYHHIVRQVLTNFHFNGYFVMIFSIFNEMQEEIMIPSADNNSKVICNLWQPCFCERRSELLKVCKDFESKIIVQIFERNLSLIQLYILLNPNLPCKNHKNISE